MGLGENIKALREARGLDQGQLGKVVDRTNGAVSQWESGYSTPRLPVIHKLADYFGVSVPELLGEEIPQAIPSGASYAVGRSRTMPMRRLGKTHAGDPMEEIEDILNVEVPETVASRHPRGFLLEVDGDCMDKAYPPGCLVLVDPDLTPHNGAAVVVEVTPGESVMRRYMRGASTLMLCADSHGEHEDIVLTGERAESARLIGTVVWFQAKDEQD